ncbi:MAG: CoA-binding protein [candidate division KSB1 bacterium]|nr:CoA-binding protein [candidate division KSB1 bacterium]
MRQLITKPFPYYVGIHSLEELVTKDSRVCVVNILGNESRKVTPISHEYSGGNVVAGVQYGREGVLETKIGDIPVYRSVRDVMNKGIWFDIGVIYLPPPAVAQAVWEFVRFNPDLKRIVIVTEKVSVRDSRNVRWTCQNAGVDVIGANCLGIANVWDHVRVGGALGGDNPEETLQKGSIAIHSNSGNFTTTIAQYLKLAGFGISTAVSSGKDVYIHFALAEFLYAAQNDPRTKAVALYVEPGGYYEKQALDWIKERRFGFNKPIVVCVTGRWKKNITRACGHAGALAGSGDDAESKERWFDEYFEVPPFDPKNPLVSKRGVRVTSIQHFPDAMRAVFEKIDEEPDFPPTGDLSLKLWISDNIIKLPKELHLPVVQAMPPYDEQIKEINKQVGASYIRQNMRNKSGASRMDPATQVAELHGKSVLELSTTSFEENLFFALAKVMPGRRDLRRMNMLLNMFLKTDKPLLDLLEWADASGCSPNALLAARAALIGKQPFLEQIRSDSRLIIDLLREYPEFENDEQVRLALEEKINNLLLTDENVPVHDYDDLLYKEIHHTVNSRPPVLLCDHVIKMAQERGKGIRNKTEFLLAALIVSMFWNQMLEKRISRQTAEDAVFYIYLAAQTAAFSVVDRKENKYWQKLVSGTTPYLGSSFSSNLFQILFNRKPDDEELTEFRYLLGLTATNGPGTLSAKGAKESVSARNDIPTAFAGFLTNTGYAHGGNGYEAVEYLLEQFQGVPLQDPGKKDEKLNLKELANRAAKSYAAYKQSMRDKGDLDIKRIPCINHPVFKGNAVNIDPREDFIRKELEGKGIYNAFHEFYHHLVVELHDEGVTPNIFCVNVDAVLAVIALKLMWRDLQEGRMTRAQAQKVVFLLFLLGRTVGTIAEIIDHRDRGLDMDCRTPQEEIQFVL